MNVTRRQLAASALEARARAFEDAASHLRFALHAGFADNPAAVAGEFEGFARSCREEANAVLTGSAPLSGLPTHLRAREEETS